MSNPFERFDIDPTRGTAAITERLRELAEDADESERDALRAVWEELTLHPQRRLMVALAAFPETRASLAGPPPPRALPAAAALGPLRLVELAVIPRVARALGGEEPAPPLLEPIEADPLIDPRRSTK